MKSKSLIIVLVLTLILQACNLPSNAPVTETPSTEPTQTPSATQPPPTETPTQTALPTDTPLPTFTSTPTVPIVFPKDVAVNCRYGPERFGLSSAVCRLDNPPRSLAEARISTGGMLSTRSMEARIAGSLEVSLTPLAIYHPYPLSKRPRHPSQKSRLK